MLLPKVIVILGSTSSGKTALAVRVAEKFNGEIISADSRQVYQGMDIGTGKDLNEYGSIPYHLIDIISPKTDFSVARYQTLAYQAIKKVLKKKKLPIICGGTGLYLWAVIQGYCLPKTKKTKKDLQVLRHKLAKLSLNKLLVQLKKVDPKTYKIIDRNNRRRVQRALEIYYQTGLPKSRQQSKQPPPYNFLILGLSWPKEELNRRIESRLGDRLEKQNLIGEVRRLHKQGVSYKRLEDFGLEYRWMAKYLQHQISYEQMFEELKKAICQFAKRQMTWFKRESEIIWLKNSSQSTKEVKKFLEN